MLILSATCIAGTELTSDGKVILHCPQNITCNSANKIEDCHISDNEYGIWNEPSYWGRYFIRGEYKLEEVTAYYTDSSSSQQCSYRINDKQRTPIYVYLKEQMNVEALQTPGSKWVGSLCKSKETKDCPFVQASQITIKQNPNGVPMGQFYYINPDNYGFDEPFISTDALSYNQLYKICGANSYCMIDLGFCSNDICTEFGIVILDISSPNLVKIIDAKITDSRYSKNLVIKRREPFNIIFSDIRK